MKSLVKTVVMLLSLGWMLTASAADPITKRVELLPGAERGEFKLLYLNQARARVMVTITNQGGNTIWRKSIVADPGFILPINLSQKDPGRYKVRVTDQEGTVLKTAFVPNDSHTAVFPCGENKYRIVVKNGDFEQKMKVEIYGSEGHLHYSESLAFTGGLSRKYDLGGLDEKQFSFHLCNGGKVCNWFYF